MADRSLEDHNYKTPFEAAGLKSIGRLASAEGRIWILARERSLRYDEIVESSPNIKVSSLSTNSGGEKTTECDPDDCPSISS